MGALLAVVLFAGGPEPTHQSLVYFNARMALREGRATEVVKLWLLRNTIESETGKVSAQDEDFRSVTWAAMGQLGLCPDGYPKDDGGAGLWPLALHNWVVKNMRRPLPGPTASPFRAFEVGRQQRFVSTHDVLDAAELGVVTFRRTSCLLLTELRFAAGESWRAELTDKRVTARLLRHLLRQALTTLSKGARGRPVIEARIFDINLRLAGLSARAQRRSRRKARREGRRSGLSRTELAELFPDPADAVSPDSEEGRILRASLGWTADDWLAMSSERRQFLFAHAVRIAESPGTTRPLKLAIIDRLIEARQGAELESFIAHLGADDEAARRLVWAGDRGRRLLSLDRKTGFRGRAAIALHRGVDALSAGRLPEAIRSLAHALNWADLSRTAGPVRNLTRRWLSFVASQFRVTDELFAMLRSVVPRADYTAVLEDQLWHAALRADKSSFDRCVRHQIGHGALERRADVLRPLAGGDAGKFTDRLAESLVESPHFAMRFLRRFLERLQAQDADVRASHVPTLQRLKAVLEAEVERAQSGRRQLRGAEALLVQIRAIVEGLPGALPTDQADQARALSPDRELFVGSFRVAPSDRLPWPFVVADINPPLVFTQISLRPEEWRSRSGALVFGWAVGD